MLAFGEYASTPVRKGFTGASEQQRCFEKYRRQLKIKINYFHFVFTLLLYKLYIQEMGKSPSTGDVEYMGKKYTRNFRQLNIALIEAQLSDKKIIESDFRWQCFKKPFRVIKANLHSYFVPVA